MWLDTFNQMRKNSDMSLDELCAKSGVPKGTLTKITSGVTKAPALETMRSLVYAMGYTLDDLDRGLEVSGSFSKAEKDHIKKYRVLDLHGKEAVDSVLNIEYKRFYNHLRKDNTEGIDNITYLKYFDFAVSAGTGEPLGEGSPSQRMAFPTEIVPENAHYCLRVNGHSMEPAYEDGDIVFVQRMDTFVREGEIGIFVFNGEGYIKQLGHQELISLNPEYPPLPIGPFDRCDCQGRVLGKV